MTYYFIYTAIYITVQKNYYYYSKNNNKKKSEKMPATLEQTSADPNVVDVTCERSESNSPHCVSSGHSRSASSSSDGSQPSSPRETSEKKKITRVSLSSLAMSFAEISYGS